MEIFSSSRVMAGYFVLSMGASSSYTLSVFGPFFVRTVSGVSNMNWVHCFHQSLIVPKSPSYMLMTVGRHAGIGLPTTSMVLVYRSGMLASRLLPIDLSFMNPLIILRVRNSLSQYARTSSL